LKSFADIAKNNGQYSLEQVADQFGIPQTRAQFIPGRFYSLRIISPTPNLNEQAVRLLNDGKPYLDLRPCGLAIYHENWKETVLMVNLRVIPPSFLPKILEAYYAFSLQNGLANLFKAGQLRPLDERRLIDQRFYTITPSQMGIDLNFAINKYNMDAVAEARLIDWDNFGMLVRPRFSQVGIFPEELNMQGIFETITEKLTRG
jgi:hypothetical protein